MRNGVRALLEVPLFELNQHLPMGIEQLEGAAAGSEATRLAQGAEKGGLGVHVRARHLGGDQYAEPQAVATGLIAARDSVTAARTRHALRVRIEMDPRLTLVRRHRH